MSPTFFNDLSITWYSLSSVTYNSFPGYERPLSAAYPESCSIVTLYTRGPSERGSRT